MTFIIITLVVAILGGLVSVFANEAMLDGLYMIVFDSGSFLTDATGINFFSALLPVTYGVGMSLIILKFLKKMFDVYVLWTDGDPDADPMLLMMNFVRAIGTALIFQWLYGLFADICKELTETILGTISGNSNFTQEWITGLATLGIVPVLAGLVFMICYLILLFSFISRGIEMMVMQIGVPLACVGLLDNDKGVFKAYINQFVKAFITTIVQIMLCKIGITLMLGATITTNANIIGGIGCMIAAISIPKVLREFLVPTSEGKAGNTVFQTVHTVSLMQSVLK